MFSFIELNLYGRRLEKSYERTLFNGDKTRLIMKKCTVFGTDDAVKLKRFVIGLSAAADRPITDLSTFTASSVYVMQYVNLINRFTSVLIM